MDTTRHPRNSDDPEPRDAGAPERGTVKRETPVSSPPGPWDQEAESFGAWLSRHRRVRGIELREIAEDSKIGMTYLQAFEDDRFDILPAPVFAKGFLRQYANFVGLDPEEVVNFYLSAAQQSHERAEEIFESPTERHRIDPLKLTGLVVGAVVAVLILIWFLTTGDGAPDSDEPPTPPGNGSEAAANTAAGPTATAVGEPAAGRPAPTADGAGVTHPAAAEGDSSPLRLTLDFSGECWVEVSVDGERRIAENKIQGESLVLEADRAIDVTIGDVGVVEAELNGRPFRFGDTPGTKVRNQRFDLGTVAALDDPVKGES